MSFVAILTCFVGLAACADRTPHPESAGMTECTEAGPSQEVNVAMVPSADWTFVQELRVGAIEGGDSITLGRIEDIGVDDQGRIFAADVMGAHVLVYDPAGRFIRRIGRSGRGPGEFREPMRLLLREDTLLVWDPVAWRITRFDTSGTVLGTTAPPRPAQFGQVPDVRFTAAGGLMQLGFDRYQTGLETALGNRARAVVRGPNSIERWDDSAPSWEVLTEVAGLEVYVDMEAGRIQDVAFARRPLWAPAANGDVWHTDSGEYTVSRFTPDGARICTLALNLQNPPVTAAERDAYYQGADLTAPTPERVARAQRDREALPVPAEKPPLARLLVAADGPVWVGRTPATGPSADSAEWDVLDPAGAWLAVSRLPIGFIPHRVVGERVYGVERDSLGVNYVAVYRRVQEAARSADTRAELASPPAPTRRPRS